MNLRVLAEAEDEAQEAARWYEERENGLGFEFLDELSDVLQTIERRPRNFPRVEGIGPTREVRRMLLGRFPFKIINEIRTDEVLVLAIAHDRRRPNYWKRRKG